MMGFILPRNIKKLSGTFGCQNFNTNHERIVGTFRQCFRVNLVSVISMLNSVLNCYNSSIYSIYI
jgi:hypothetical protein